VIDEWEKCERCPLHIHATNHVVYEECEEARDKKSIDVLFIGEAPGVSEDLTGRPFIGPAGKVLRSMINDLGFGFTYGITNTVACMPRAEWPSTKFRAPSILEIDRCRKRVEELIDLRDPLVIVLLGKVARESYFDVGVPTISIYHPSYILRNGGVSSEIYQNQLTFLSQSLKGHIDV